VYRAAFSLERTNRGVAIESDDERIAKGPGLREVANMAGVEKIEASVREDEPLAFPLELISECGDVFQTAGFGHPPYWHGSPTGARSIARREDPATILAMHDPRIDELSTQLVGYSTRLQPGEKVLIEAFDVPSAVPVSLIRAVRKAGAIPFVNVHQSVVSREMAMGATGAQYQVLGRMTLAQMEEMDAYIAIRGSENITEVSDVPAEKMSLVMEKMRPTMDYRVKKTRWTVLRWPTSAMAQQAGMSTEAFEDFFFRVCLLDYRQFGPAAKQLKKLMDETDEVHVKGEGTDLRFSIKGLEAVVCTGEYNIPDGEVFTAPVKDSVEGVISFNAPSIYQGIAFDGIKLEFEQGKIVNAEGSNGKALNRILDQDEGARYVGEFALAFNPEITEPMRDILFDEKISGSFHFTPGQAYEGVTDNGNKSQVHWDLVCIQREDYGGGEIFFDGELVRKDGKFLPKGMEALNGKG